MGKRQRIVRETLFAMLYQADLLGIDGDEIIVDVMQSVQTERELETPSDEEKRYIVGTFQAVRQYRQKIEVIIENHMDNWSLERLGSVERVILCLAVYELTYEVELAPAIVINEAVELAKVYGDEKSSGFINGVLAKVVKK